MSDSGAVVTRQTLHSLAGMRGLMAKPQKAGAEGQQIIENPTFLTLKKVMSVLEYFISSHGCT